jgi:propanediol dehydratase small subunit
MSEIDDLVSKIMSQMGSDGATSVDKPSTPSMLQNTNKKITSKDYPLYTKHPELIHSPSGKNLDDINVDNLLNDNVKSNDLRITPETLRLQGEVAVDAGRDAIQQNFQRAAELTAIPDERLLEMYNALRPYRSTKQELLDIASELKDQYNAKICAGWFEEAAEFYETRKKLKGDN